MQHRFLTEISGLAQYLSNCAVQTKPENQGVYKKPHHVLSSMGPFRHRHANGNVFLVGVAV